MKNKQNILNTLSVLVENESGALIRMAGLFARRGFNIESLAVGISEKEYFSRVTMVVPGTNRIIDQLIKQLYKLLSVVRIQNVPNYDTIERELMLLRVNSSVMTEPEIVRITNVYKAKVVDFKTNFIIVEISGNSRKVLSIKERLDAYGIKELASTGRVAVSRLRGGGSQGPITEFFKRVATLFFKKERKKAEIVNNAKAKETKPSTKMGTLRGALSKMRFQNLGMAIVWISLLACLALCLHLHTLNLNKMDPVPKEVIAKVRALTLEERFQSAEDFRRLYDTWKGQEANKLLVEIAQEKKMKEFLDAVTNGVSGFTRSIFEPKVLEEKIKGSLSPKIDKKIKETIPYIGKEIVPYIGKEIVPYIRKDIIPYLEKETIPSIGKETIPYIGKKIVPYIRKDIIPSIGKKIVPYIIDEKIKIYIIGEKILEPCIPYVKDIPYIIGEKIPKPNIPNIIDEKLIETFIPYIINYIMKMRRRS